jgi:hypothetical protein
MLNRISTMPGRRTYWDDETATYVSLKPKCSENSQTSVGVHHRQGGYIVGLRNGNLEEILYYNKKWHKKSLCDRKDPEAMDIIGQIRHDWRKGSRRELFIVDSYARTHMQEFRELWDDVSRPEVSKRAA